MPQNIKTSEIITDLKTRLQPIGEAYTESGCEMQLSTSEKDFLKKQTVPRLFEKDVNDSMIMRIYEIKNRQQKQDFYLQRNIDQEIKDLIPIWEDRIRCATNKDIAVILETIASTLSCDVPNDAGLQQYFRILIKYPAIFLEECAYHFIETTRYRKLPLPSEFISFMELRSSTHMKWVQNIKTIYEQLERKINV